MKHVIIMEIKDITGKEFESVDKTVALLPVGSIERHGDHLPLGTDGELPSFIAREAGKRLGCIVLPTVWYGSCNAMRPFPGTFDLDQDALYKYIASIITEAERNGIRLLVILNGHGGNATPVQMAARAATHRDGAGMAVVALDWWKELGTSKLQLFKAPGHAGEDETSAMLAVAGGKVKMGDAIRFDAEYPRAKVYSKAIDRKIYPRALTGDATAANEDSGKELMAAAVEDLVSLVKETLKALGITAERKLDRDRR